jgi:hypothetical protein
MKEEKERVKLGRNVEDEDERTDGKKGKKRKTGMSERTMSGRNDIGKCRSKERKSIKKKK